MSTLPTAIYVEDDPAWRDWVYQFIVTYSRVEFDTFLCGGSIEEVEGSLQSAQGPVVLIMDLRLGGDINPNFDGYHWLLAELEQFLSRNAETIVFVISGQLNLTVRETLRRVGIPANHLFDKGKWAEERAQFVHLLREELAELRETPEISGRNIDSFLRHCQWVASLEVYSMVIEIADRNWQGSHIPGLQELDRCECFVACVGRDESLAALARDPVILFVEPVSAEGDEGADSFNVLPRGPGDGTSLRERVFESVPSGHRLLDLVSRYVCHGEVDPSNQTRLSLTPGGVEKLEWLIGKKRSWCLVEIWFEALEKPLFQLIDPETGVSDVVGWLDKNAHGDLSSDSRYFMTYTRQDPRNGRSRFLLTLFPSAGRFVRRGKWALEITGEDVSDGSFDAWLVTSGSGADFFLDSD